MRSSAPERRSTVNALRPPGLALLHRYKCVPCASNTMNPGSGAAATETGGDNAPVDGSSRESATPIVSALRVPKYTSNASSFVIEIPRAINGERARSSADEASRLLRAVAWVKSSRQHEVAE